MFKLTVEGSTLDELKANLAAAVAALGGMAAAVAALGGKAAPAATTAAAPKGGAAKPPKVIDPTDEEPDADEDDGSEGIEPQAVSEAVVKLSKTKGRDVAINFLKTLKGANGKAPTKAAEILPKDYPAAMAAITELMEAEDDIG